MENDWKESGKGEVGQGIGYSVVLPLLIKKKLN